MTYKALRKMLGEELEKHSRECKCNFCTSDLKISFQNSCYELDCIIDDIKEESEK